MKKATKLLLCLTLILGISNAISCINYEVYSTGNCYKVGDIVVGEDGNVYVSKTNDNCCKSLSDTKYWQKQVNGACDGPCAGLPAFEENQDYPAGTRVHLEGVIYENSRHSDNEYPQPYLFENPWKAVGTCYINCQTAPIYQNNKIYHFNSIVQHKGYLYVSLSGYADQKPNQDNGYQGAQWLKIFQCIPQGVLQNYDITGKSNLVPCYVEFYGQSTERAELDACGGQSEYLLVGGYHISNPNLLLVAAYGKTSVVLQYEPNRTGGIQNVDKLDNAVYWYYYQYAFGFSDVSYVFLTSADAAGVFDSYPFTNTKVSWHLSGGGGWRLGTIIWLNNDYNYKKVIYRVL